ncbi:outer membrane protein assembly factor BamA, partial [Thermodesulfobacteriota bacterium]
IENDINNLPDAIRKIAASLSTQIRENILVEEILVEGNHRASDDGVLTVIESQKGDIFDQDKLDRDLRTVYKMGIFSDVNIDSTDGDTGKIVTFSVTEKPYISKIIFEGNDKKKDDKLIEEIGIKRYDVLDRNEIRQSINRLLEVYKEDGYYNIEISGTIENIKDDPENAVNLVYVINEGTKVYITDIQFTGNTVFKDKELRKYMLTKEKGWLTWFTDSGVLDKKKLDYDLYRLTVLYGNNGYIKAGAGDPKITHHEDGLTLNIPITEDKQYIVDDISFEGDLILPADTLKRFLTFKIGEPFNREAVFNDIEAIKTIYANLGYAYTDINPVPEEKEGTQLVTVSFNIQKNKKVRFERINIIGNKLTRDKVIRRELQIAEGEYFNGIRLDRSSQYLDRLGFIESNEIKTKEGSSDDLMVVDVEIEERPPGSITFSAGYGGFEKFALAFEYANSNLGGYGRTFSLNAMLSSRSTRFNLSLTEPWLFDKRMSGSFNIYRSELDYDQYTREMRGLALGYGLLLGLDEYTWGSIRYSYDDSKVTDINPWSSLLILDMAGAIVSSSVRIGIERNSQDRPWNTTRGSVNSLSMEFTGGLLGGDTAFNKYTLNSIWYFPLKWNTVLVANGQLGYVKQRSGGRLPLYEKFRLGGIDSIRGYEWGTVSPLDPRTVDEIGGDKMWLYKLEFRFPLMKDEGIRGLVFFDAGNAFTTGDSWMNGAARSVGFGLRWYSPMGPLRLEYGFKLNDRKNDPDTGRFEFKVGGTF